MSSAINSNGEAFVIVKDLVKHFPVGRGFGSRKARTVQAVNGISFDIAKSKTFALVGESGCGKSTAARCISRLIEPSSGEIIVDGQRLNGLSHKEMRAFRRRIQFVFQDPFESLTPHMSVGDLIVEPMKNYRVGSKGDWVEQAKRLMERVGLRALQLNMFPHEFSGGQRQRICIARALALNPDLLLLDEPVSALDVSIQAQVLNLLMELQEEFELTFLFISHDLSVVKRISIDVAVMYRGNIVEMAKSEELFANPVHPYTLALLSSIPRMDPKLRRKERILLEGDLTDATAPIYGCPFEHRCPRKEELCSVKAPVLEEVDADHLAACHFIDQ